jgi:hypothetical protein
LAPDSATLTAFSHFGFKSWLARVKRDASVTTTMNQLADFIAWCKQRREFRAEKLTALQVLVKVATTEKDTPEKYNEFLHSKNFKPASMLNRIDAVFNALSFMRFVLSFNSCNLSLMLKFCVFGMIFRIKRPDGFLYKTVCFLDILDTIKAIKTQLRREKLLAEQKKAVDARMCVLSLCCVL